MTRDIMFHNRGWSDDDRHSIQCMHKVANNRNGGERWCDVLLDATPLRYYTENPVGYVLAIYCHSEASRVTVKFCSSLGSLLRLQASVACMFFLLAPSFHFSLYSSVSTQFIRGLSLRWHYELVMERPGNLEGKYALFRQVDGLPL